MEGAAKHRCGLPKVIRYPYIGRHITEGYQDDTVFTTYDNLAQGVASNFQVKRHELRAGQ